MSRSDTLRGTTSVYISLYLRQQADIEKLNLSRFLESALDVYFKNKTPSSSQFKTHLELSEEMHKIEEQKKFLSIKEIDIKNQLMQKELEQQKRIESEKIQKLRKIQAIRDSGIIGEMHK